MHAGRLVSQAELSRWKDRLQTAPVCVSSSMWRARRSANKRAAPGWRLTCTVYEEVVFTVAARVRETCRYLNGDFLDSSARVVSANKIFHVKMWWRKLERSANSEFAARNTWLATVKVSRVSRCGWRDSKNTDALRHWNAEKEQLNIIWKIKSIEQCFSIILL